MSLKSEIRSTEQRREKEEGEEEEERRKKKTKKIGAKFQIYRILFLFLRALVFVGFLYIYLFIYFV